MNHMKSIYGGPGLKSIYGGSGYDNLIKELETTCACTPNPPPINALINLLAVLVPLKKSIEEFYPPVQSNSPFGGKIALGYGLNPAIYVRILWTRTHPGVMFDKDNNTQLGELVDIYLSMRLDWRTDKYLLDHYNPPPGV